MRLTPRPLQAQVIPHMLAGHYALWWKPGKGKTLPAILAGEASGLQQLWITLADLRTQAAEIIREQRSDRPTVQVVSNGSTTISTHADVVVVSYDLMREPAIWRQLFSLSWGSIVIDEAHALRDTSSVRTRAFYGARQDSKGALFRRTSAVWILTGTPVMNNPLDLYSHISRLWPDLLPDPPTKEGWLNYHCTTRPGEWSPIVTGARQPNELRAIVNRIGSVAELDLATRLDVDTIPVEITPQDRQLLEASATPEQWAEMVALFADMDGGKAREAAQATASLLPMTTARRVLGTVKAGPTAALAAGELNGGLDQIIVWGHHREALLAVATKLKRYRVALINGSTPRPEREKILARFRSGEIRALVAGMTVVGAGIDGLQCSQRALLMEPDWLPGTNTQVIARQYREGQRHPVHASLIAVARSPDDAITRVLARRAAIIHQTTGASA